jgi:ceramide kinase
MSQHKHKNSFIDGDLPSFTASDSSVPAAARAGSPAPEQADEDTLIQAPTFLSPTRRSLSRKRSGSLISASELVSSPISPSHVAYSELSDSAAAPSTLFRVSGRRVKANLAKHALCWQFDSRSCFPRQHQAVNTVPYDEILAVRHEEPQQQCSSFAACPCAPGCCGSDCSMHCMEVHTFERRPSKPYIWRSTTLKFHTLHGEGAADWTAAVQASIRKSVDRPRSLLVFLNPFGGARQAQAVWDKVARPVMLLAGIQCTVVSTERGNHARGALEALPAEELARFDGVVAVGGDGLFQETLNALLTLRAEGGDRGAVAARLRLGHIPAGSTDAVAYSLNGTRAQETAALHIALGDRTRMDVMRVDTVDGQRRFCCCVAAYGYMGDLMAASEGLRWAGPGRYNLAGALSLLRNKSYRVKIEYLSSPTQSYSARKVCGARCELCRAAGAACPQHTDVFAPAQAFADMPAGNWETIEGEFNAIMAVVLPCRSDRSDSGLAPFAHIADGCIHLIMVRKCSAAQYLRFLASIPRNGVIPEDFPYVDTVDASAVRVQPIGKESSWSVDGELLQNNHISAKVYRGLIDVFARGIEYTAN